MFGFFNKKQQYSDLALPMMSSLSEFVDINGRQRVEYSELLEEHVPIYNIFSVIFEVGTFELFYSASRIHVQPDLLGSLRYEATYCKLNDEEEFSQLNERAWSIQISHCQALLSALVDQDGLADNLPKEIN